MMAAPPGVAWCRRRACRFRGRVGGAIAPVACLHHPDVPGDLPLGRLEDCGRLLLGHGAGRPARPSGPEVDEVDDVPADQVAGLGTADRPPQGALEPDWRPLAQEAGELADSMPLRARSNGGPDDSRSHTDRWARRRPASRQRRSALAISQPSISTTRRRGRASMTPGPAGSSGSSRGASATRSRGSAAARTYSSPAWCLRRDGVPNPGSTDKGKSASWAAVGRKRHQPQYPSRSSAVGAGLRLNRGPSSACRGPGGPTRRSPVGSLRPWPRSRRHSGAGRRPCWPTRSWLHTPG